MTEATWMVRAEGGTLFEKFASSSAVAVGWEKVGDLSATRSLESLRAVYAPAYPNDGPGPAASSIGILFKFRSVLKVGDRVLTYNPEAREYLVGNLESEYLFSQSLIGPEWPHVRRVKWLGRVSRDDLSPSTRSTLGSALTLFAINDDAATELSGVLNGAKKPSELPVVTGKAELSTVKEDESAKALELIKDAIVALSPRHVEELVAALLRAMGYRAKVTPVGPDRGVDVLASRDGLGLEAPRIKAEGKHRAKSAMGAVEVRGFLGGLREGDRGLYISTGGFTKEARYEAERSTVPLTLIDLTELASLVVARYEDFDVAARVILPLVKVYLPGDKMLTLHGSQSPSPSRSSEPHPSLAELCCRTAITASPPLS